MVKELCGFLLDALFLPRCPLCGAYVDAQGEWCALCYRKTVRARTISLGASKAAAMRRVTILCGYRAGMQKPLRALKYRGEMKYLPAIHRLVEAEIAAYFAQSFDLYVPVPLHAAKLRARGFNQTEKIFRSWAEKRGLCWQDALERIRETGPQHALAPQRRRANLLEAFAVKKDAPIASARVLLFDDIFTTGATMAACAKALRRAGAQSVEGLALAGDAENSPICRNSIYK